MMRYFLVFFCLLCPAVCVGADVNTKFNWSYGALSDTMKSMRNNCELTHADGQRGAERVPDANNKLF